MARLSSAVLAVSPDLGTDGAKAFLLCATAIRIIRHACEPIPLLIVDDTDRIVPLSLAALRPKLAVT